MPESHIRILILEDIAADADLIEEELRRADFTFETRRVRTEPDFSRELDAFDPHVVLSDYVLESFDGLSALECVRRRKPNLPFIFVSWEIHEDSVIEALRKGATDYVFKDQISRLTLSVVRGLREAREREELRLSQEKIIEQERLGALGKMASGIAHDFSNALTPVMGYSELLINNPESMDDKKKRKYYVEMIHMAAKDAMHIVNQLREFYRRKEKVEKLSPVNLKELAEQSLALTQPKWKAQAEALGVKINIQTALKDTAPVLANDAAMREAVTNLIFNAVDAMPEGGTLKIATRNERKHAVIEIADTGVGMDEEVRRHCFEPFFSTKGKRGTGMGLPMVYGVIRRHDGLVDVVSEPGRGTSFVIRLPQCDEVVFRKKRAPQDRVKAPIKPLRILVVDDERNVLDVMEAYLKTDGHRVETVEGGQAGLKKFRMDKFDVVFTDWAMPGMNGDEFVERLKDQSPTTPVIMLTGFGDTLKPRDQKQILVDSILSKPPTLQAIRDALEPYCRY